MKTYKLPAFGGSIKIVFFEKSDEETPVSKESFRGHENK